MAETELCGFCHELVFHADEDDYNNVTLDRAVYGNVTLDRTSEELQRSAETTSCPFCKAFYEDFPLERLDALLPSTRYFFEQKNGKAGLVELSISLPRRDMRQFDSLRYSSPRQCYVEDICHWMVAYAQCKIRHERPRARRSL